MEKFDDARSFIRMAKTTIHTNKSRKRGFSTTLFKLKEIENGDITPDDHVISLPPCVFLKRREHNSKITGDCCAFKFLRGLWTGYKTFHTYGVAVERFLISCFSRAVPQNQATTKHHTQ